MSEKKNVIAAAKAASDAIWFNDNSDYLTALWEVVGLLSPESITYLERNERPPLEEPTSGAHGDDSLLERWEKLPISQQRMLLDGHAPYIARLEANLAELQARIADLRLALNVANTPASFRDMVAAILRGDSDHTHTKGTE